MFLIHLFFYAGFYCTTTTTAAAAVDLPQVVLSQEEKETERAKRAAEPRSTSEAKHERRARLVSLAGNRIE